MIIIYKTVFGKKSVSYFSIKIFNLPKVKIALFRAKLCVETQIVLNLCRNNVKRVQELFQNCIDIVSNLNKCLKPTYPEADSKLHPFRFITMFRDNRIQN